MHAASVQTTFGIDSYQSHFRYFRREKEHRECFKQCICANYLWNVQMRFSGFRYFYGREAGRWDGFHVSRLTSVRFEIFSFYSLIIYWAIRLLSLSRDLYDVYLLGRKGFHMDLLLHFAAPVANCLLHRHTLCLVVVRSTNRQLTKLTSQCLHDSPQSTSLGCDFFLKTVPMENMRGQERQAHTERERVWMEMRSCVWHSSKVIQGHSAAGDYDCTHTRYRTIRWTERRDWSFPLPTSAHQHHKGI